MALPDLTFATNTQTLDYTFPENLAGGYKVRVDYLLDVQVRDLFADQEPSMPHHEFEQSVINHLMQIGNKGAARQQLRTISSGDVIYSIDPQTKRITAAIADYYVNQTLLLSWERTLPNGKVRTEVRAIVFSAASPDPTAVLSAFPDEPSLVLNEVREVLDGSGLPDSFADVLTDFYFSEILGL